MSDFFFKKRKGVLLGERTGITVVGFTRNGRFNGHTHPERIVHNGRLSERGKYGSH